MVSRKKLIIIGIAIAIAIILMFTFIFLYINNLLSNIKPTYLENGNINTSLSIFSSGLASYNNSLSAVIYSYLNYNIKNATSSNIKLYLFKKNPYQKIYLINPSNSCYNCFNLDSLENNLSTDLKSYGLINNISSFQIINLLNTSLITPDSTVIIPTGLFPASLLPGTGFSSSSSIKNLITLFQENDTIIYVGDNFSRLEENGQILLTNNLTSTYLNRYGLETFQFKNTTITPQYHFSSPTFRFVNGSFLGSISYINLSSGSLVALSNYPKLGWENSSSLSQDISRILFERFWIPILAEGSINLSKTPSSVPLSGKNLIITLQKTINATGNYLQIINSSYPLLIANSTNGYKTQIYEKPFNLKYLNKATIGLPSVIGYGELVPTEVSISPYSTNKAFSLIAYNSSLKYIYSFPLNFFNTSYSVLKYTSFDVPTGQYYIASLVDINNNSYGNAAFYVPYLNITSPITDFKNASFVFSIISGTSPLSNMPYTISINGQFEQQGTVNNGIINYTLPKGTALSYGYQVIKISLINVNYTVYEYYQSPPEIPPLYIEFGIAAFVILLLNIILRPPNTENYFIDVPQMLPIKKEEVIVKSDQIISLFDTLNFKYNWKYMPLTSEEIKMGISNNIRKDNMPLSITLQNTKRILYKLSSEGKIISLNDYYLPMSWITKSGHDGEYLIIFRRLRDFFVSHAIPFTDIDKSVDSDMVVNLRGKTYKLFIFSKSSGVRPIKVTKENKNILIFISNEEKLNFIDSLYSVYNEQMNELRLAIYSGYLELGDIQNLISLFS
ncbi:MAG: hypothetical protein QXD23_00430 [Candidatus Micrarchaeaceae archaeon]